MLHNLNFELFRLAVTSYRVHGSYAKAAEESRVSIDTIRQLREQYPDLWEATSEWVGVELELRCQIEMLTGITKAVLKHMGDTRAQRH